MTDLEGRVVDAPDDMIVCDGKVYVIPTEELYELRREYDGAMQEELYANGYQDPHRDATLIGCWFCQHHGSGIQKILKQVAKSKTPRLVIDEGTPGIDVKDCGYIGGESFLIITAFQGRSGVVMASKTPCVVDEVKTRWLISNGHMDKYCIPELEIGRYPTIKELMN